MSKLHDEEYLDQKVRVLVEPLIANLLREKPAEPVFFLLIIRFFS